MPERDNAFGELDGLWVQPAKCGAEVVPHIDIKGKNAILCKSRPADCDYSDRVSGTVSYNPLTQEGSIKFTDGTNLNFLCDEAGSICTLDTIPYYKIDNTLDNLQNLCIEPKLQFSSEYVGPDHDLGIDLSTTTLLGDSKFAVGAGGAWYTDLLKFAGESIAKGALSYLGGQAMSAIFSCFYTDPTSQKLETLISQVGAINSKLDEIKEIILIDDYEFYINSRASDYSNPLANYSKRYADALAKYDEDTDSTLIADVVNRWHDDGAAMGGKLGGPMEAASNFMDFLMNTRVQKTNLYDIYDIYTFNCVPWEHQGYDFRQTLRGCDLALVDSNVKMAMLYAKIHNWDKIPAYESYVSDLDAKFKKFIEFCESAPVNVDEKNFVCQIKGAHFVMDRNMILRDYNLPNGMTWYSVGSQFVHGDGNTADQIFYGGAGMSVEQFRQKQIKPEELNAMDDYYDKSLTWLEIFRGIGASFPQSAGLLLLCGGTSSDYDDNLYVTLTSWFQLGEQRRARYTDWLQAKTHWSITFRYWFDGWNIASDRYWVDAVATDVLYRY